MKQFAIARYFTLGILALFAMSAEHAQADIIISLTPKDPDGAVVTGAVDPGAELVVDVLLSVDADDAPLADVRRMRFDFSGTSAGISLGEFTWTLDSLDNRADYLTNNQEWDAAYFETAGEEGRIVVLDTTPVRVATIAVTVNSTGTLSAIGPANPQAGEGAIFRAGFETALEFSPLDGNVSGDPLTLTVGATDPDPEPDTPEPDDDNTNQGPRAVGGLCGMGMVGTCFLTICGLIGVGRLTAGRRTRGRF